MRYDPVARLKHFARGFGETGLITIDERESLIAKTKQQSEANKEQQQVSELGPFVDGGDVHGTKK
jgi:hypothetical protein